MILDTELLRQFVDRKSDAAFTELVKRKVDLVYSAALRQVRGDQALASEVTQQVFLTLARKAAVLTRRPVITGWLFTCTRLCALAAVRAQQRRRNREEEARTMQTLLQSAPDPDWRQLWPLIDQVIHELPEKDAEVLLLRYFDQGSFSEIGKMLGLNENSARMRTDRALERLRARLARRGITSTAAALEVVLATKTVMAAPPELSASVALASLTAGGISGPAAVSLRLMKFMSITKLQVGISSAVIVILVLGVHSINQRNAEIGDLKIRCNTLVKVNDGLRT